MGLIRTKLVVKLYDRFRTHFFPSQVMVQNGSGISLSRVFRGAVPIAMIGSGPSFAVFFGLYAPSKRSLEERMSGGNAALLASLIGGVPSSLVAVPADVIKKRILLCGDGKIVSVVHNILKEHGFRGLFVGWQVNFSTSRCHKPSHFEYFSGQFDERRPICSCKNVTV